MAGRQSPCPGIQLFGSLIFRSKFLRRLSVFGLMGMALVACFCLRADPPRRDTRDTIGASHGERRCTAFCSGTFVLACLAFFLLFEKTGQVSAPSGQSSFATLLVRIFEGKYPDILLCPEAEHPLVLYLI